MSFTPLARRHGFGATSIRARGRDAFTMVDVLVGFCVLGLIASSALWALIQGNVYAAGNRVYTCAEILAQNEIDEFLSAEPYNPQFGQIPAALVTGTSNVPIVARAVHDELGGELTGLKLDVAWLAKHLAEVPEAAAKPAFAKKLNEMSTMLDSTIDFVRKITTQLRPGVLDILGFTAAIEWQAREFEQRTGIVCEVHLPESDIAVDADRSTALFRIFQEILTNIARHAQATKIEVLMVESVNSFALEVRDNGRGIREVEITDPMSLGLLGMRERALVFGGQVTFKGVPDEGTTVTVWVPLES